MSDKELADRVVALEVANRFPDEKEWWIYSLKNIGPNGQVASQFVRDWRVAGALMEKLTWSEITEVLRCIPRLRNTKASSRAIIEACVEALSNGY